MYKEIIELHREGLDNAIDHLEKEAAKLRTGRANPSLVEDLEVENYGVLTPIKQVANISTPEARQLLVQPWDKSNFEAVEKVITDADLGANISNDGIAVRLVFPPMTEENRVDLVKVLNQKAEEARVTVRNVREEIWKEIQKEEKEGNLTEDDKFAGKDALQEVVDDFNKKIEDVRKKKEEEIMTI
ncbi:MAG: ribosome recycling factor [Candidatus Moraniibacteriota bacterium]|nr:MAG: ribosome recycling factor [Candidatus Moranbacteria bacterium]